MKSQARLAHHPLRLHKDSSYPLHKTKSQQVETSKQTKQKKIKDGFVIPIYTNKKKKRIVAKQRKEVVASSRSRSRGGRRRKGRHKIEPHCPHLLQSYQEMEKYCTTVTRLGKESRRKPSSIPNY